MKKRLKNLTKSMFLCVVAHELTEQFLLLSPIMENAFVGIENDCDDTLWTHSISITIT